MNRCAFRDIVVRLGRATMMLWYLMVALLIMEPSSVARPHAVFESGYSTTTVFHQHEHSSWSFGSVRSGATVFYTSGGWQWRLQACRVIPHGRFAASDNHNLYAHFVVAQPFWEGNFTAGPASNRWCLLGSYRPHEDSPDEGSIGISLRPLANFEGSFVLGHKKLLPFAGELQYDDEIAQLKIHSLRTFTRLELVFKLACGLELKSVNEVGDLNPRTPYPDEDYADIYDANFNGLLRDGLWSLDWQLCPGWWLNGEYHTLDANMQLMAYSDGYRFAHFGIADLEAWQLRVGIKRKRWEISVSRARVAGELAGSVEAWPFAAGLLRFLGERRHFIGEAELKMRRITVDAIPLDHRHVVLHTALDWFRVHTEATYNTWRPVMFGFGVDDMRAGQLHLRRADILLLRLEPEYRYHRFRVQLAATQLIPVSTDKRPIEPWETQSDDDSGGLFENEGYRHQGFSVALNIKLDI